MEKNDRIHQIMAHLASAASVAADGVSGAVHSAGKTVSDKYDVVKLNIEINRLQDDQKKIFSDIGRTMFLIKDGALEGDDNTDSVKQAQDTIDNLLLLADQKQKEIDAAADRLSKLSGSKVCPVCGKITGNQDAYCSNCGAKLPGDAPEAAAPDAPAEDSDKGES